YTGRPGIKPVRDPVPEEETQAQTPAPGKDDLSRCEKDILYYLIKFGQTPMDEITVCEYIENALAEDELELRDPFYAKIFNEYKGLSGDDTARRKHFINHPDPDVSQHILDLLNNPHPINLKVLRDSLPLEESLLKEHVTKSVLVYKLNIVSGTCSQLTRDLQQAQMLGEEEKIQRIVKDLMVMMDVRNSFAKELNRLN
ncbi:MAG TPA: hypothetical protein PK401_07110, partial [Bacteroidales bacterium]|nr:hypothetical protein [Bacteroidales bacterium]